MDSPESIRTGVRTQIENLTPKPTKKLYWPRFNEENIPKMCDFPERQEEFGWGDSPEPLKWEKKLITGYSKKRIDCSVSPVSSHSKRYVKGPPAPKPSSPTPDNELNSIIELRRRVEAKTPCDYQAVPAQNLDCHPLLTSVIGVPSKRINNDSETTTSTISSSCILSKPTDASASSTSGAGSVPTTAVEAARQQCSPVKLEESSFERILQSFHCEEDDDWLSQVDISSALRETPSKPKTGFSKSRSHNQLESPSHSFSFRRSASFQSSTDTAKCKKDSSPFFGQHSLNRTASFPTRQQKENKQETPIEPQPLKKQKSFHNEGHQTLTQCSLEEIEKKRLEAKYRREFREIERRKLEAQKRLHQRARMGAEIVKR